MYTDGDEFAMYDDVDHQLQIFSLQINYLDREKLSACLDW